MTKVIALDVDEVILELVDSWLDAYNSDFNDDLKKEQITDWDISLFVKESAKERIFSYINNSKVFYRSNLVDGSKRGVQKLRNMDYKIVFATANNPYDCKYEILKDEGFLNSRKEFMEVSDKSLIHANYLFDDSFDNCVDFQGDSFLFTKPWNRNKKANLKGIYRVDSWDEFVEAMS